YKKSTRGTDSSTSACPPRGSPDCCTKACADGRTNDGPCDGILIDRLLGALPDLQSSPLSACSIFNLELIKGFSGTRQYHHARPRGNSRTSVQHHKHHHK